MWTQRPNSPSESLAAVCRAASNLKRSGRPPLTLFWSTGHRKFRDEITIAALVAELRANPELIETWRLYSADKRGSPAWYFDEEAKGCWVVGYYHDNSSKRVETTFNDPATACAHFILREMGR